MNTEMFWFYIIFGLFFIVVCLNFELYNYSNWIITAVILSYILLPIVAFLTFSSNYVMITLTIFFLYIVIFLFVFEKYNRSTNFPIFIILIFFILLLLISYLWYYWKRLFTTNLIISYFGVIFLTIVWSLVIGSLIVDGMN